MTLSTYDPSVAEPILLSYFGIATIRQSDHRFDAAVTLFVEGSEPAFGHYYDAPEGLENGPALLRLPGATEADIIVAVADLDQAGSRSPVASGLFRAPKRSAGPVFRNDP